MKLKNMSRGFILCVVCCFLMVLLCLYVFFFYQKPEAYQDGADGMDILVKFCDHHFGEGWGVDHIFRYNDKLVFFDINTQGAVVSLSLQPEGRVIIIEKIKGRTSLTKRIYRF